MNALLLIFPIIVVLVLALKLYLNYRQQIAILDGFHQVPHEFTTKINLNDHQKAGKYNLAKLKFNNFELIYNSILVIILTTGGGLQYISEYLNYFFLQNSITHGVAVIFALIFISSILTLPFTLYLTFVIEEKFGFNRTTLKLFIMDNLKSTLIYAIIGIPFLYLILWLMNIMGNWWWLWVWIAFCSINIVLMLIYPIFIAPLFNKFQPLSNPSLFQKINELLIKCGFKAKGIFIMDGSKRSSHGNAYFTGIGKSKRIVFFDTLINNLSENETEAVLAHELGHFKYKHILKQIILSFAITLITLFILNLFINNIHFYNALGVSEINKPSALILFSILLSIIMFPLAPALNYLSRKNEFEADNFAKKMSNKDDLISGLIKLYKENASTLTPDKLYVRFYYSHPPAIVRINNLKH